MIRGHVVSIGCLLLAATVGMLPSRQVRAAQAYPADTARALPALSTSTVRPGALDPVSDPSQAGVLWFAQTGHTLSLGFRAYWEANGGLAQFGYPLSEEFQEFVPSAKSAYTVQYFERNRFEWHPENAGTSSEFLLGRLGSDLTAGAVFPLSPPFGSDSTHRYFPETGHSLGGAFLNYWNAHGGLAIYGFPISEEILEQLGDGRVYLVQYFERNRFELHPEHRGTPDEVQLGRLGVDLLRNRGWIK